MDIILVSPAALRAHWPHIKASLEAVQAKAPEDWIPEDVYHSLKSGEAACYIGLNSGGFAGLLVTTVQRAAYSGEASLHVWIAHSVGQEDVFEGGLSLLRSLAAQNGFKRITFSSPRQGWAKRFPMISATYEVPL